MRCSLGRLRGRLYRFFPGIAAECNRCARDMKELEGGTMRHALTESVVCPLCKSSHFKTVRPAAYPSDDEEALTENLARTYSAAAESKLFDAIAVCCDCSLLYLNPRVRHDIIIDSYVSATEATENPIFVRQAESRISTFRRNLRYLLKKYGLSPSRDKFVLDVGCAAGAFPKAAHDLGFKGKMGGKALAEMVRAAFMEFFS